MKFEIVYLGAYDWRVIDSETGEYMTGPLLDFEAESRFEQLNDDEGNENNI